jgi:hypothetical protein
VLTAPPSGSNVRGATGRRGKGALQLTAAVPESGAVALLVHSDDVGAVSTHSVVVVDDDDDNEHDDDDDDEDTPTATASSAPSTSTHKRALCAPLTTRDKAHYDADSVHMRDRLAQGDLVECALLELLPTGKLRAVDVLLREKVCRVLYACVCVCVRVHTLYTIHPTATGARTA